MPKRKSDAVGGRKRQPRCGIRHPRDDELLGHAMDMETFALEFQKTLREEDP